jgi:hypothetical protein
MYQTISEVYNLKLEDAKRYNLIYVLIFLRRRRRRRKKKRRRRRR